MQNARSDLDYSRRGFGLSCLAAGAALALPGVARGSEHSGTPQKFCAFIKFLQELNYEQLATAIAGAGFDGVEVTAREKEGYLHPAKVADELPQLQEVLSQHNLEITILTTDILRADQPYARSLLSTAAGLGIERYRLGFYRYDLKRPVAAQLTALEPVVRDLAALNGELGIAGIYQNHCGADFVGAALWDLYSLIKDIPLAQLGCVFDIRHTQVEAGEAWPQLFNLMQPHLAAVSVKDYVWQGFKSQHAPLGQGRLDPKFFKLLQASGFSGPISVHVEYLPQGGTAENLQALATDLQTLKKMLAEQS